MSYVNFLQEYKREEQKFKDTLEQTAKTRHAAFEELAAKTEELVQDMTRVQMLDIYASDNGLDARAKKLLVAAWIKTHQDDATVNDMLLCVLAGGQKARTRTKKTDE